MSASDQPEARERPLPGGLEEWADLIVDLVDDLGGKGTFSQIRQEYKRQYGGRLTKDLNSSLPGTTMKDLARQAEEDELLVVDGKELSVPGRESSEHMSTSDGKVGSASPSGSIATSGQAATASGSRSTSRSEKEPTAGTINTTGGASGMASSLAESGDGRDSVVLLDPKRIEEFATTPPPTKDTRTSRITIQPQAKGGGPGEGMGLEDGTVQFAEGIRGEPATHQPSTTRYAAPSDQSSRAPTPDQDRDEDDEYQVQGQSKPPEARVEVPWRTAKPPGPQEEAWRRSRRQRSAAPAHAPMVGAQGVGAAGGHHWTAGSVDGVRSVMASTMTATPSRATGGTLHGAGSVSSSAAPAAASGGSQHRRAGASASSSSSMIERGVDGGKLLSGTSAGAGARGTRGALLTPSSLAMGQARTVAGGGGVYRPPPGAGASGGWSKSGGAARAEPQVEAGLPPVQVSRWEMRRWEAVLLDLFRLSPPGSHVPSAEVGSRFKMRFGRKISEALKEVHPEFLMAHVLDKLVKGGQLHWNGKGGVDGRWWLPAEKSWGATAAKGQDSGSGLATLGLAGESGRRDQGGSGAEAASGRSQGGALCGSGSQCGSGRSALGSESGTEARGGEARSPGDRSGRATAGGTGASVASAIGSNAGKGYQSGAAPGARATALQGLDSGTDGTISSAYVSDDDEEQEDGDGGRRVHVSGGRELRPRDLAAGLRGDAGSGAGAGGFVDEDGSASLVGSAIGSRFGPDVSVVSGTMSSSAVPGLCEETLQLVAGGRPGVAEHRRAPEPEPAPQPAPVPAPRSTTAPAPAEAPAAASPAIPTSMTGWIRLVVDIVRHRGGEATQSDIGSDFVTRTRKNMGRALVGWRPGTRIRTILDAAAEREALRWITVDKVVLGSRSDRVAEPGSAESGGAGAAAGGAAGAGAGTVSTESSDHLLAAASQAWDGITRPNSQHGWIQAIVSIVARVGGSACQADIGNQYTQLTGVKMRKALVAWKPGTRLQGLLAAAEAEGYIVREGTDRVQLAAALGGSAASSSRGSSPASARSGAGSAGLGSVPTSPVALGEELVDIVKRLCMTASGAVVTAADIGGEFRSRHGTALTPQLRKARPGSSLQQELQRLSSEGALAWNGLAGVDGRWGPA